MTTNTVAAGQKRWYALDGAVVVAELETDGAEGLSSMEAARRLAEFGPNELSTGPHHPARSKLRFASTDSEGTHGSERACRADGRSRAHFCSGSSPPRR